MSEANPPRQDEPQPPAGQPEDRPQEQEPSAIAAELEREVEQLRAKADENWQEYLRAVAEVENLRKRAAREVENVRKYGVERLASELLSVVDSLQMGLDAARQEGAQGALLAGQEATLKQLLAVLEKHGVTPIEPQGERFDPEYHEAMSMVPTSEVEPGSVTAVVQTGYLLHDRLLRPARVLVAAEPRPSESERP